MGTVRIFVSYSRQDERWMLRGVFPCLIGGAL